MCRWLRSRANDSRSHVLPPRRATMSWNVASYDMSRRFTAGSSLSPTPPLRANACSARRLVGRRPTCRFGSCGGLDQQPEGDQRAEVVESDQRRHHVPASRFFQDQALGLDPRERLADRRGRHPERPGERLDVESGARAEGVVHEHVDQDFVHVVGRAADVRSGAGRPPRPGPIHRSSCRPRHLPVSCCVAHRPSAPYHRPTRRSFIL